MSHKKRKTTSNVNIENALLKLEFPMVNNKGNNVELKLKESSHSTSKHIAKQYHGLTVQDIKLVPEILKNPLYITRDPSHREKKNYYGRRHSKKIQFIKIVTKVLYDGNEVLITIFTTNHIKR